MVLEMCLRHLLLFLCLNLAVLASSKSEVAAQGVNYRLPNTTYPHQYTLWLTTYVHRGETTYDGELTILIEALEDTPEIVLHARGLFASVVYLFNSTHDIIETGILSTVQKELETLTVKPTRPLVKGESYYLFLRYFASPLRNDGEGFFRSSYVEADRTMWLASTRSEQIQAREIFPW